MTPLLWYKRSPSKEAEIKSAGERFSELVQIMDRLRGESGCPWDKEQTLDNLKTYMLEEVYEVLETIDERDHAKLREEMGDLLFQIVFICRIMKEEGRFEIADVIDEITTKMVRRHPHVFGDSDASTSEEVLVQWEEIKANEKSSRSIFHEVAKPLPALLHSHQIGAKAARVGFDWPSARAVLEKLKEEIVEIEAEIEGGDSGRLGEEIGDLLLATSSFARLSGVDPEDALRRANIKFIRRFKWVEERLLEAGERPRREILAKMEALWQQSKSQKLD